MIFLTLMLAGLAVIGGRLIVAGVIRLRSDLDRMNWDETTGTVLQASYESWHVRTGVLELPVEHFRPHVVYSYSVNGATHVSKRIASQEPVSVREYSYIKRLMERYRPQAYVPVYYDPVNPGIAVLERGLDIGFVLALWLLGLLFIGIGLGGIALIW